MARYRITTPEQVYFHYDPAGLMSRGVAWLIDQAILTVLRIAIAVIFVKAGFMSRFTGSLSLGEMFLAALIFLMFVLDFGYFTGFELFWKGQSPGKRILKMRVISSRGGHLSFNDILIRNLLRAVDTLPGVMLLGGSVAFFDPLRRRLGDLTAETMVIRDTKLTLPATLLKQQGRVNSFQEESLIRNRILARVTREERDLLLDLMVRRDELEPNIREDLFAQTAGYIRERYALPDALAHLSDEQTVLNAALVIQGMKFS